MEEKVAEYETAMPVTPSPSGEHTAELTPNVELSEPISELTIDTDAETCAFSSQTSVCERCLTSTKSLSSKQE